MDSQVGRGAAGRGPTKCRRSATYRRSSALAPSGHGGCVVQIACLLSHRTASTSGGEVTHRPPWPRTPVTGSVFLNLLRTDSQYLPGRGGARVHGTRARGGAPRVWT
eukprot:6494903-Alexandrium_andersonii.AAC.1